MLAEFRAIVDGWRLPESARRDAWQNGYENALLNVLTTLTHKEFVVKIELAKLNTEE